MIDGTIYKKLGVKPGFIVYFANGHENFFRKVRAYLPEGVKIKRSLGADEKADLIFVWPEPGGAWPDLFKVLRTLLREHGAIWAVLPRKEIAQATGRAVYFGDVQNAALRAGLVDNKKSRASDREYAIRFVRRTALSRPATD